MKAPDLNQDKANATRILLIEDVTATAEVVKAYLAAASGSVHVEWVVSLAQALDRIAGTAFDLIIADLNLPDSAGLETLDGLARATNCLIIVLTVEEGASIHEAAIARGAYDFLNKRQLTQAALGRIVRLATIQARTFHELRESEARFRALAALGSDFYWETDARHRIVQNTSSFEVLRNDAKTRKTPWEIPSVRPDAAGWAAHRATIEAHRPFRDFELSRLDGNGLERHLSISGEPVFDQTGRFTGYRGVGREITSRKQTEDRLRYLATRDALTGLPNRTLFADRFAQMASLARRQGTLLAVLFVDLDGLKKVNDLFGHAAGDETLRLAARALESTVREGDTVARLSGDEFAVLLGGLADPRAAQRVANKINEALEASVRTEGRAQVSASIGIALYPADGSDADALLRNADTAMYRAKQAGRSTFRFFGAGG